jgi:short-subunit dehydrogenase
MRNNILITGASSGLGREMARQFADKGRNLALSARRMDNLEELKSELEAKHPDIKVIIKSLDVNDHDSVFRVFKESAEELGGLDRVIVNAGLGHGASVGKGKFHANLRTAQTNFIAAIAQCEAAMEIFYAQNHGHLVTISSISALRGFRRALTVYAATKAGLSVLTEGIRVDALNTPITVTTIHPGFIASEINEKVEKVPFIVPTDVGTKSIVDAIEKEKNEAFVPGWPWAILRYVMKVMPLSWIRKMS